MVACVQHGGHFCLVLLLEHSLDLSMISTCGEAHMSWPKTLLVLMTDVISKGSGEHVRLCNLVWVSLLTTKVLKWTYIVFKILENFFYMSLVVF